MRKLVFALLILAPGLTLRAQTMQIQSNLNQLMRGVLYPEANVVFSAQSDDPGKATPVPGQDPSMATDPLVSTFGGWQAVENAALALTESANLLLIPGRSCANGVPVPSDSADWLKFVEDLRAAAKKSYEAAQSKDQARMIEVSETLSKACAGCHRKWRDGKRAADRCK